MPSHLEARPANRLALPTILVLVAVAGWGLLFVSQRSAAEFEEHLRAQVSSLHQRQMELLNERAQRDTAVGTLEKLRSEVAALQQEQEGLIKARDQIQADLTRLRAEQDAAGAHSHRSQTAGEEAEHASIVTAQRALTKLGYGPLALDGIVGPGTRQAIEDFQHDRGLRVTSELDPATLRQLTASNKTATLE
ncbi:peptidoglycan-binding domain-containing protein [Microvirga arabica]|uniref:peptidoglycan-binding domain-containing protein n=1 Tax=Microvirga arabica TaxID=1128671 RepID=UPI00193A58AE|nr:peptidoglycan-binding domain-containing protein [Microvirga arabica]MBM1174743.1 peptidoglycan-binding protein [Microvirga arabica]